MAWKNVQYQNGKFRTNEGGGGGGASTFADLDDVNFSNLQDGQVPKYNSTTQKWENADESGGGGTVTDVQVDGVSVVNQQGVAEIEMPTPPSVPDELSDLSDVQFSNLTDNQPLRYNATSQKWVNGADSYPPLIYSDEEREVGVWRDGKPLYQKTINVPISSITGNETTIDHNIANVDTIYFADGCMIRGGNLTLPLVTYHTASSWASSIFNLTRTSFVLYLGSDERRYVLNIYVTLRYTKTTDTAGSGTWTTQGTLAHHYSTAEHVVGTWIDGKPLYEKTYIFTISDLDGTYDATTIDGRFQLSRVPYDMIWIEKGFINYRNASASTNTIRSVLINYPNWENDRGIRTNIQVTSAFYDGYPYIYHKQTYSPGLIARVNDLEFIFVIRYTKTTD